MFVCFCLRTGSPTLSSDILVRAERETSKKTIPVDGENRKSNFRSVFYSACSEGNGDMAKEVFVKNPTLNPNWSPRDGWTALHAAAYNGHANTVEFLLKLPGIDVNSVTGGRDTPFLLACYTGQYAVINILLKDARVNCYLADDDGRTPLWWAAFWGRLNIVKLMLASARPMSRIKCTYWRDSLEYAPNEIAREMGHREVAFLLEKFFLGHPNILVPQIQAMIGISHFPVTEPAVIIRTYTLLSLSSSRLGVSWFSLFPTVPSQLKRKFFDCCQTGSPSDMEALMNEHVMDINWQNNQDDGAVHIATRRRDPVLLKFFLNSGANVNLRNKDGHSSLHIACINSSLEIIRVLLDDQVLDVNLQDAFGCTALWWVAMKGNMPALEVLLSSNKSFNRHLVGKQSDYGPGFTPVEIAAHCGQFVVVKQISQMA